MATYLLDTNVIIDAINEKKGRNRFLINLAEQQGHTLACCPINVSEVYAGMRPKEEPRTTALLKSLQLYPITFPVAEMAGLLKRDYGKKGIALALPDAIVAAVAIHNQLTLITENTKHFPMKELTLYPLPN
ncbi:MAG: type II toxin-antitoxin system VapC family toxin [Acidobacteriia bacterium]|nr:type II toxin-antitoxin system VapC family toxin [Terriglobia bacterium]